MTNAWRHAGHLGRTATLFFLFWVAAGTNSVLAQSPATGGIRGLTTDAAGVPLAEALVTLRSTDTDVARYATTDREGRYRFPFAVTGEYELFLERIGYTPVLLRGVTVHAGATLDLATELAASPAAAATVDTVLVLMGPAPRFGGHQGGAGVQALVPGPRLAFTELARGSVRMSADGASEGLPGMFSGMSVDGTLFRTVRHPYLAAGGFSQSPLGVEGIGESRVVTNGVDVEWGRVAGARLAALSRTGGARSEAEGVVLAVPGAVSLASEAVTGQESAMGLLGSAAWSGPVLGDSARASVGVTFRRLRTPVAAAWGPSPTAAALAGALPDGARYVRSEPAPENSLAAHASLDWLVGQAHRIWAGGRFGHATEVPVPGASPFAAATATDFVGGAALHSAFGVRFANELRVGVTRSERDALTAFTAPLTHLAGEGVVAGGSTSPAMAGETVASLSNTLHVSLGAARTSSVRAGLELSRSSHTHDYRPDAAGSYYFGDAATFAARQGVLIRREGTAPLASWGTARPAAFAQADVSAGSGVTISLGARVERENLPDAVQVDTAWRRQTGIDNTDAPGADWHVSPRLGIHWDVEETGRWIVSAGAGLHVDRVDPLLLADWLVNDGSGSIRRVVGDVPWPTPGSAAGLSARSLTVLAPGFVPPRTARASGTISHVAAPGTVISLGGSVRRTDDLPRRADLNLLPLPAFRDQYGRGVFGTLVQHGGLVAAEPGTGRRFDTHDEVAGVTPDGWSEFWGIELSVEHQATPAMGWLLRYGYGQARDNWVGAAAGAWNRPLPAGFDGSDAWTEGPSDFDQPHRLAAGIHLAGPAGLTLGALYRLESGLPFTPGFRAGVDASGDGFAGNDPAFVDPALNGMAELIREWPCLQASSGRIAARNSCRAAASHALDLSLAMDVLRRDRGSLSLLLQATDLLESAARMPDAALYLIDPARSLAVDTAARTIDIPVLVNPSFGESLPQRYAGRSLRLGAAFTW